MEAPAALTTTGAYSKTGTKDTMTKYLLLAAACALLASVACSTPGNSSPTSIPTPSGPALSVEEYTKACYSSYEKMLNKRDRPTTQNQMRRFILELQELIPPRSLEKFHFAYLAAWERTADEGLFLAAKEMMEASAQIGQLDDETYAAFMRRAACGFDETFTLP